MPAISADTHNQIRRAQKAKQRANRRASPKNHGYQSDSILALAAKDKRKQEQRKFLSEANEKRLLAIILEKHFLQLNWPDPVHSEDFDWDEIKKAQRQYEYDVRDAKAAVKRYNKENGGRIIEWSEGLGFIRFAIKRRG